MLLSGDADPEALISHLAGPLSPPARVAFRQAAEDALTRVPYWGEGAVYRAIAVLQRDYFIPPSDHRAGWDISQDARITKLTRAPSIEYGGDLRHVRNHRRPAQ